VKVGYIRTSKKDQNPELQCRDLLAFGRERLFEEQISSRKEDRPELGTAMDCCRGGDELVVWKLDRFRRSLRELIDLVNEFRGRGVEFVSLRESIDTTTPGGMLVFHVFGAVAEFERDLILERTMAGLEAAKARGRKVGRKPAMDEAKIALASKLVRDKKAPISEACESVGSPGRRCTVT
jgi:DNA invertase Pin-like site-specific DNA recombinase